MTHEPNTPRTHNTKGQRANEPRQCIVCLQAWPCEVARLTEENANLLAINRGLMRKLGEAPIHIYGEETL